MVAEVRTVVTKVEWPGKDTGEPSGGAGSGLCLDL